jgi:hypothetical protein
MEDAVRRYGLDESFIKGGRMLPESGRITTMTLKTLMGTSIFDCFRDHVAGDAA